ncbi:MAG: anti-sigma factor [Anaerolineae bacterium]
MAESSHALYELAQYVADGEPNSPEYQQLRNHLAHCSFCRGYLPKLRRVEVALQTYPKVPADAALRFNIARIVTDTQNRPSEWHAFPWTVWVPAATIMAASLVALYLIPNGAVDPGNAINWQTPIVVSPQILETWLQSFRLTLSRGDLATIGGAIAAILGGTGIFYAVSSLGPEQNKQLDRLGNETANRARQFLRARRN